MMNRRVIVIGLSILALVTLLAVTYWAYPRVTCLVNGGSWVRGGILGQATYCHFTYSDGGKSCQSSDECLGGCVVSDLVSEVPEKGTCKRTSNPFGCYGFIENPELVICWD
jgi:hypothetical protein